MPKRSVEVHAARLGGLAIHVHVELRHVGAEARVDPARPPAAGCRGLAERPAPAARNRGCPCPLRFCRFISTPAVAPRPGISGRLKAKAMASCMPKSFPLIRPAIASSDVVRAALVPVFSVHEDRRAVGLVRAAAEDVEPHERHDVPHRRLAAQELLDPLRPPPWCAAATRRRGAAPRARSSPCPRSG